MAHVWFEINGACRDLEIVAGVVFDKGVAAIGAAQAALMLVGSELLPAVGVCANPSATSRTGTTMNRRALFINPPKILALWHPKIRLGLDSASDFSVRALRL
jgi:hypothetical protein